MIAGQNEHIFWLGVAFGTRDVFFVFWALLVLFLRKDLFIVTVVAH